MDIEGRFIYSLLTGSQADQDKFYKQKVPKGIFRLRQAELDWIYEYRETRGKYPSLALYKSRFRTDAPKHGDDFNDTLQTVIDNSAYEQMRAVGDKVKKLLDSGASVKEAMGLFKTLAAKLSVSSADYVDLDFSESKISLATYKDTVKLISESKNLLVDLPWPTANKIVHFYRPGNTVILAARTNLGKTWIITYWAHYLACKGIKVLFITKEMPSDEIADRFEAIEFQLPFDQLKSGDLSPRVYRRWQKQRKKRKQIPLIISGDETVEGVGLSHVVDKIERYKPTVVFIDGAYLLRPEGVGKNANKVEMLTHISNRCKALAKAKNIVVIMTLQLNRDAEKSKKTSGKGVNIYGADAWLQDCDGAFVLNGERGSNRRRMQIEKGRDSAIGDFDIEFNIHPYPDFPETQSSALNTVSGQSVQFKKIL